MYRKGREGIDNSKGDAETELVSKLNIYPQQQESKSSVPTLPPYIVDVHC